MIAHRLVGLIETHADVLARGLMERVLTPDKMVGMRKVPTEELKIRVYEVYRNLSDWLLSRTESDIERRYNAIGTRRATQGVPLSHLLCAILTVKEHLWDFLQHEAMADRHVELVQELELLRMVDQFFDRAAYYAARGYEHAIAARAA